MTEQQGTQQSANDESKHRCVCNEFAEHIQDVFGVSPAVREHLKNSRIEFLKAIRSVIDEKIDRMSRRDQRGASIAVE
ncbi:MAG TPA: hypothetical protein VMJ93_01515 [Verrucomicrobiae bacterium]|nr:hypothetical protein [Verrucomicrobiae bacterium]